MKSKIENNILIQFNPEDLIDGFFECSEVNEIGEKAFCKCNDLIFISLPQVTKIGNKAFYCCFNLSSVSLPQVINIGNEVFSCCENLNTISLPQVLAIGDLALSYCRYLNNVYLPQVAKIGDQAFSYCPNLNPALLPQAIELGNEVFKECCRLETIVLYHVRKFDEILINRRSLKCLIIIDTNLKIDRNDLINRLPKELKGIKIIIQSEQIQSLCNANAVIEQNTTPDLMPHVINFSKQLGFFRPSLIQIPTNTILEQEKEQEQTYFNKCTLQ